MKLLITGICGFVGSTLATSWLEKEPGITVFGVDNLARTGSEYNRRRLQKRGVRLYHGDIRLASDLELLPQVDWVIDAAASSSALAGVDGHTSSRQLVEHNLLGTFNTLEFCKRHGAGFVLLSTSRVYSIAQLSQLPVNVVGEAFCPAHGTAMPTGLGMAGVSEQFCTLPPLSLYGSSKLASEILALEYGDAFGFPVWINRCGALAGAGQFGRADQGIFSYWINSWLHRNPLRYIGFGGAGYQVRDCLHPRDLLSMIRKQVSVSQGGHGRIFNLGGGIDNAMSLANLSAWCTERFGPHQVGIDSRERIYDIPWLVMDSSLARDVWEWQPETSLQDILEEIAAHAELNPEWLELSGAS
jgi:CDP-paratose 2-epimerase